MECFTGRFKATQNQLHVQFDRVGWQIREIQNQVNTMKCETIRGALSLYTVFNKKR